MSSPPSNTAAGAVFSNQPPQQQPHPQPLQTTHHLLPATATAIPSPTQRQQQQQQQLQQQKQKLFSNSRIRQRRSSAVQPQDPHLGIPYPVPSSGNRGFLPEPLPVSGYFHRPYGFSNSNVSGQSSHHLARPSSTHLQQRFPGFRGAGVILPSNAKPVLVSKTSPVIKGTGSGDGVAKRIFIDLNEDPEEDVTINLDESPKRDAYKSLDLHVDLCFHKEDVAALKQKYLVVASSSVADGSGSKDLRDKSGEDTSVIIRDKMVQDSEGCLSRSKNGFTEENQAQYVDCEKSLPVPLTTSMVDLQVTKINEKVGEIGSRTWSPDAVEGPTPVSALIHAATMHEDGDVEDLAAEELLQQHIERARKHEDVDVENLSAEELLQHHIKRARKVRARVNIQRLDRIEMDKRIQDLRMEQQKNNDSASIQDLRMEQQKNNDSASGS